MSRPAPRPRVLLAVQRLRDFLHYMETTRTPDVCVYLEGIAFKEQGWLGVDDLRCLVQILPAPPEEP